MAVISALTSQIINVASSVRDPKRFRALDRRFPLATDTLGRFLGFKLKFQNEGGLPIPAIPYGLELDNIPQRMQQVREFTSGISELEPILPGLLREENHWKLNSIILSQAIKFLQLVESRNNLSGKPKQEENLSYWQKIHRDSLIRNLLKRFGKAMQFIDDANSPLAHGLTKGDRILRLVIYTSKDIGLCAENNDDAKFAAIIICYKMIEIAKHFLDQAKERGSWGEDVTDTLSTLTAIKHALSAPGIGTKDINAQVREWSEEVYKCADALFDQGIEICCTLPKINSLQPTL